AGFMDRGGGAAVRIRLPSVTACPVRRGFLAFCLADRLLEVTASLGQVLASLSPAEDQPMAGGIPQLILHLMQGFQPIRDFVEDVGHETRPVLCRRWKTGLG